MAPSCHRNHAQGRLRQVTTQALTVYLIMFFALSIPAGIFVRGQDDNRAKVFTAINGVAQAASSTTESVTSSHLTVPLNGTPEQQEAIIATIVFKVVPEWKMAAAARVELDVSVTQVLGSLTNFIWKVSLTEQSRLHVSRMKGMVKDVLVRAYGTDTNSIIDRPLEGKLLQGPSQTGYNNALIGKFANGRVEQWLDGYRPITLKEMRNKELSEKIGMALSDLHHTDVSALLGSRPSKEEAKEGKTVCKKVLILILFSMYRFAVGFCWSNGL